MMMKNKYEESIMVSEEYADRFDPNSIVDQQPPIVSKSKKSSSSTIDANTVTYDDTDTVYYSVDGDNRVIPGYVSWFSRENGSSITSRDIISFSIRPLFADQRDLAKLIKDFMFSNKNIIIHNLSMNDVYMFDEPKGMAPATANFDWHIQNVEYKDEMLTFSISKHI